MRFLIRNSIVLVFQIVLQYTIEMVLFSSGQTSMGNIYSRAVQSNRKILFIFSSHESI